MDLKTRQTPVAPDVVLSSAALQRLIEEVAAGTAAMIRGYNRTHNRHNR
jgi:hypothetical protein